jgi:hypothetical protein
LLPWNTSPPRFQQVLRPRETEGLCQFVSFLLDVVQGGKLLVQHTNEDGGLPRLGSCWLLADVRNTAFKVGGAACLVCIDCGGYPATKARDQQRDRLCRVTEGVGGQFVSLQPDSVELVSSQGPAVKDEQ